MGLIKTLPNDIYQIAQPVHLCPEPPKASMTLIFDTAEQTATAARSIPAMKTIDELQRKDQQSSEEFVATVKDSKSFLKALTKEKLRARDVSATMDSRVRYDYVAQGFGTDQAWYVD
ncbi:hypothetical protein MMC18_001548 [Xylographa bjoerkii]|nr:hypothetical protein [Xylographa bjoerkii]